MGPRPDSQGLSFLSLPKVSRRRVLTSAAVDRKVVAAITFLIFAIEVVILWHPGLITCFEECARERACSGGRRESKRAAFAAEVARLVLVILEAPEVGQDFVVRPTFEPASGPSIIVAECPSSYKMEQIAA